MQQPDIAAGKMAANGGLTMNATVDYAPVTIGIGIVYFLF
jgi:hypothetical protein